jgi:hypothetical protein
MAIEFGRIASRWIVVNDGMHHAFLGPGTPQLQDDKWLSGCFIKGFVEPEWDRRGSVETAAAYHEAWDIAVASPEWAACRHGIMSIMSACDDAQWCDFWSNKP